MTGHRVEQLSDSVVLHCGDCREVLPSIRNVDAVVTDPPYGINHASSFGASWQDTRIAGDSDTSLRDDVLRAFENVASFGTWKTPPLPNTKGALVFDKGPAFGMGDLSFPWKGSWELIYIKGEIWRGRRDEGVLRGHLQWSWETRGASMYQEGRTHPHQKPVSLCCELIKKLPDAATILDPFMGSGTTGVACVQFGLLANADELVSSRDMARELGTSPKTIIVQIYGMRHTRLLKLLGINFDAAKGKHGGYRMLDHATHKPLKVHVRRARRA